MAADLAPAHPVLVDASEAGAPVRDLLASLAAETGELARCADGLQDLLGRLMGPAAPADALEQAQALDALVQRLDGLHLFIEALSLRPLGDLRQDVAHAAAALPLTRQAQRLGRIGRKTHEKPAGGDCDLF